MLVRDPARRPTAAALRGGPDGTHPHTAARTVLPRRRPSRLAVAIVAVGVLLVGATLAVLTGGDDRGAAPVVQTTTTVAPAPTTSTTSCIPLRYQPCGGEPAPNTDGTTCDLGFADYDDDAATGCEAEAYEVAKGTQLTGELQGNLVPEDDIDVYRMPVDDDRNLRCNGTVRITLEAPADAIQKLTVLDGDEVVGTALSADGEPGRVSLSEPRCLQDDSTTLTVQVQAAEGSRPSAGRYRLTKTGNY